ncbi:hypothetical protein TNCV_76001 [Trichonephila clavipes]|nr:hypothetical protein TNCV_76001 [Trichonephila clavipes]
MEGDSGRGELLISAVLEKSSPNSCKQTRSSSAIGRQVSVSENSIRCAWCRVRFFSKTSPRYLEERERKHGVVFVENLTHAQIALKVLARVSTARNCSRSCARTDRNEKLMRS